jgi:hypothetical protein
MFWRTMMTEKKLYICDKCKTPYSSEKECKACEAGHVPAKRVRDQKYVAIANDHTGYPTYVSLVMENGMIVRYRRC